MSLGLKRYGIQPTSRHPHHRRDPHYHEATFDRPYQDITANGVLDLAPKVCSEFYRLQTSGLPPPKELARRESYPLHYITDEATAHEAAYDSRPAQRLNPDVLKQALGWYRATGHYLDSVHVDSGSLLASKASSPDDVLSRGLVSLDPGKTERGLR